MSIPGGCLRACLGRFGCHASQRHIEDIVEYCDAFMGDGFVHDRIAGLADCGEFRAGAICLAIDKPARRFAPCAAFQAKEFVGQQLGLPPLSLALDVANERVATHQRWSLIRHGRQALPDPRPDSAVRDAGDTRRLWDRIAAERFYSAEFG